jgi:hypothetical protein
MALDDTEYYALGGCRVSRSFDGVLIVAFDDLGVDTMRALAVLLRDTSMAALVRTIANVSSGVKTQVFTSEFEALAWLNDARS